MTDHNDLGRRLADAVEVDEPELVRHLLEAGANPNWRPDTRYHAWGGAQYEPTAWHTPSIRVAQSPEVLRDLLDHGADPNLPRPDGASAMHSHQILENPELLRMVLQHGGNPNDPDTVGRHPLRALIHCQSAPLECYELLLNAGARVDHQDQSGWTALMNCRRGEVAELLVLRGANPDLLNQEGKCAWDTTVREVQTAISKAQSELAARELQASAARVELPDPKEALARLRNAPQQEVASRSRRL